MKGKKELKVKCPICDNVFQKWSRRRGMRAYFEHLEEHEREETAKRIRQQAKVFEKQGKVFDKFSKMFDERKNKTLAEVCRRLADVSRTIAKEGLDENNKGEV